MEAFLQSFVACCESYQAHWGLHREPVADFYVAPHEASEYGDLFEQFDAETLLASGLFRRGEELDPMWYPGEPCMLLRDSAERAFDVMFEGGCITRQPALLQLCRDERFARVARDSGRVCLVGGIAETAYLASIGIAGCPAADLLYATRSQMEAIVGSYSLGPAGQDQTDRPEIVFSDWSIYPADFKGPLDRGAVVAGCRRMAAIAGQGSDRFRLWRPSRFAMAAVQQALERSNFDRLREHLLESFASDLRGLDELDQPVDGWGASMSHLISRMFTLAENQQRCGHDDGWQQSVRQFHRTTAVRLVFRQLATVVDDDTPQSLADSAAAVARFNLKLKIPALVLELARLSSSDPSQTGQVITSNVFEEFLVAGGKANFCCFDTHPTDPGLARRQMAGTIRL